MLPQLTQCVSSDIPMTKHSQAVTDLIEIYYGKGIIQGKSKPCVTLTRSLLVLNAKLTYQRACQRPDVLTSLVPLIFLKHVITETNV